MAGRFVRQRKQAIARLRSIPQCGCKAGLYYDDGGKLTLGCHELGCDYLVFLRGRDWCAQCGYRHHTRGNPNFGSYWFACPKGHEHGSWFKWPTRVGSHGNQPLSDSEPVGTERSAKENRQFGADLSAVVPVSDHDA